MEILQVFIKAKFTKTFSQISTTAYLCITTGVTSLELEIAQAYTLIKTQTSNTRVSGSTNILMEKELNSATQVSTKGSFKRERNMELVNFSGIMEQCMKDSFKEEPFMVREF